MSIDEQAIWDALKTVYDPEIPVNIVDLGLVYRMAIKDDLVEVDMTLTAPGCPVGPSIAEEVRRKLLGVAGVKAAHVQLVWEPFWSPDQISEEGKAILGLD